MKHQDLTPSLGSLFESKLTRRSAIMSAGLSMFGLLLGACGGGSDKSSPTASSVTGDAGSSSSATAAPSMATPSAQATPNSGTIGTPEPAAHTGGTLVQAAGADATTLNPILEADTVSADITSLIFDALVQVDPQTTEPRGDMAKSWEISTDALTYTFTLQDRITWHDGQPFTAADVKFTYELHMNADTSSPHTAELTERVASVEAPDENTVVFTLTAPASPFLVNNMIYEIVPQHILQSVAPKALAQHPFSTGKEGTTIGTGPFMFKEWVKDDHITLVKYTGYWRGEPHLDSFSLKVVPDVTTLVQQLQTGEVDYSGRDGVDEASVKTLQNDGNIVVATYDSFDFTYYGYQLDTEKSKLFQDKAVRQALLYALDREQMVKAIRFGLGQVAIGTMGVDSWAYNPDEIKLKYPFDPDQANKLLDDAGWAKGSDGIRAKDGVKLAFTLHTNSGSDVNTQYAAVMQQSWKAIGIDCTPQEDEWNAFLERLTSTHDFEVFLIGFSWGVDPDQSNMWATAAYEGGLNVNKYSNPQVDDLLEQGIRETAIPTRKQIYTQMQNIIVDDLPSAIIDFPKSIAAYNKRVHNLFPNAVDDRWNAHLWWVDA
ncbi:MAG TPA: peptide-binding protein [Nitrolancea sp.]|nr:peptide-binding protein [Nitrolancea sp.]